MISRNHTNKNNTVIRAYRYSLYLVAGIAIIIAFPPWYSHFLQMASEEHRNKGEYIESLHLAERAVTVDPLSIEALFNQAKIQQQIGRDITARNTLMKATQLQPLNYATWELLAKFERDLWNQEELSKEHFATALSLNPQDEQLQEEVETAQNQDT